MAPIKITTIGSSTGLVLPQEALARFEVQKRDILSSTSLTDGSRGPPPNPEFADKMELVRRVMHELGSVLKELAK